jgi:hypothetical protein
MIFAVVGIAVALVMGGIYLARQTATPRLTPEETVDGFLGAVFLTSSADRLSRFVCGNWDPDDALSRTSKQVDAAARVSWDEIRVVSSDGSRANLRARLGLRLRDDVRPAVYQQWHFTLVNEDGWRVCEAQPFRV